MLGNWNRERNIKISCFHGIYFLSEKMSTNTHVVSTIDSIEKVRQGKRKECTRGWHF